MISGIALDDEARIVSDLAGSLFPHAISRRISRMQDGASTIVYRRFGVN